VTLPLQTKTNTNKLSHTYAVTHELTHAHSLLHTFTRILRHTNTHIHTHTHSPDTSTHIKTDTYADTHMYIVREDTEIDKHFSEPFLSCLRTCVVLQCDKFCHQESASIKPLSFSILTYSICRIKTFLFLHPDSTPLVIFRSVYFFSNL